MVRVFAVLVQDVLYQADLCTPLPSHALFLSLLQRYLGFFPCPFPNTRPANQPEKVINLEPVVRFRIVHVEPWMEGSSRSVQWS